MSLIKFIQQEKEIQDLKKKITNLKSKNFSFTQRLNRIMPYYLKQKIAGYYNDEISLKDIHEYLTEDEAKKMEIETYLGAAAGHYVDEDNIRESVIASIKAKDHAPTGNMNNSNFAIYKEDHHVLIIHRGMHFHTRGEEYDCNRVKIWDYKDGDKYAKVEVEVLWCDEWLSYSFKVNVEKFNAFYEEHKNKKTFEEEELTEENHQALLPKYKKSSKKKENE